MKKSQENHLLIYTACCFMLFGICALCAELGASEIPRALKSIAAEDGSVWEQVSLPGFGNAQNLSVTAMCPYNGRLYAATRNEVTGVEIWKTSGGSWEKVDVPGFTDSAFHKNASNGYGAMAVFNDHLYIGVGSKFEGGFLYRSIGVEIWRFNGSQWEPVVSNARDSDESGTITGISGCSADDGDTTAVITDASKNWTTDQWAGGVLRITSGSGLGRLFDIISNTATTLVVQQNEIANTRPVGGAETEYTVCGEFIADEEHPDIISGAVNIQDTYAIGIGADENGFGEIWNKNLFDFKVFNGELYVSIGHNYDAGTRIWKSADGLAWTPTSDYSFGQVHGYDLHGDATGVCLVSGTEDRNGGPVCSSTTTFGLSSVGGQETLYIGGTGSSGCNGRGARVVRLDPVTGQWQFIVDGFVDDNDEGTNENGFGDAQSFINQNFQAWSWVEYQSSLLVGIARVTGGRIMYTDSGDKEDGAWTYIVGGDARIPDGFDGKGNAFGYGANIVPLLYVDNGTLYAGTFANSTSPAGFASYLWNGADIWKASGPVQSLAWSRITGNGFGDATVMNFGSFAGFEGSLYVAASHLFGNFPENADPASPGATVYRLASSPSFVRFSGLDATSKKTSITLSWKTESEKGCSGFNVYRSSSDAKDKPYEKLTEQPLPATGAEGQDAAYSYTDTLLWFNKKYDYKIEAIDAAGNSSFIGPLGVSTKPLLGK